MSAFFFDGFEGLLIFASLIPLYFALSFGGYWYLLLILTAILLSWAGWELHRDRKEDKKRGNTIRRLLNELELLQPRIINDKKPHNLSSDTVSLLNLLNDILERYNKEK